MNLQHYNVYAQYYPELRRFPLRAADKRPLHAGWRRREYTDEQLEQHIENGGNVGICLGPEDLVIDIDPRNDPQGRHAFDILAAIEESFGVEFPLGAQVNTGSAGLHVYFHIPADLDRRLRMKLKDRFGDCVEFKRAGHFVVAAGSVHPDGPVYCWNSCHPIPQLPTEILEALTKPAAAPTEHRQISIDQLHDCLDQLDPAEISDYEQWRDLMFAVHAGTGGAPDAREVWLDWCERDDTYDHARDHNELLWDACDDQHAGGRTAATLFWHVQQAGGTVPPNLDPIPEEHQAGAATPAQQDGPYNPQWRMTPGPNPRVNGSLRHNIREAIRFFGMDFWRNEMTGDVCHAGTEDAVTEADLSEIQRRTADTWGNGWTGEPSLTNINETVEWIGGVNGRHPLREYLDGLEWDGQKRLDTWLSDCSDAENTEYVNQVARLTLIAAVARAYKPGVKFDTLLILEGPQGSYKSTLIGHLGGKWAGEGLPPFRSAIDKDVVSAMQGSWIIEIEEMSSVRKVDADALKAFLSRTKDRVRLPYERRSVTIPRSCIFIGTLNPDDHGYLQDTTGNRRFFPVEVGQIDMRKVERDQLWAEAVLEWRKWRGELTLPTRLWQQASEQQELRRKMDPWEETIEEYKNKISSGPISTATILWECFRIPAHEATVQHYKRIAAAAVKAGLKPHRFIEGGSKKRGFLKE